MYSTPVEREEEGYMAPIDASHVTVIKISPIEDGTMLLQNQERWTWLSQIRTRHDQNEADQSEADQNEADQSEADQNEADKSESDYTKLESVSRDNETDKAVRVRIETVADPATG